MSLISFPDSEVPERPTTVVSLTAHPKDNYLIEVIFRLSSFIRLQWVFAYVLRFISKVPFRSPESITSPKTAKTLLSVKDLKFSHENSFRVFSTTSH